MKQKREGKGHGKEKAVSLGTFIKEFSTKAKCQECPKKSAVAERLRLLEMRPQSCLSAVQWLISIAGCHHQTSMTAGTALHRTYMPLVQWLLAFYFVSQDKRSISTVALMLVFGTTYKIVWYMLGRIRATMCQRNKTHHLNGIIEFDDTYFGGPTVGKKRGRGTEKAKVFAALSLDESGNPRHIKMQVTQNIKRASVKKFAQTASAQGSTLCSDDYGSYIPALEGYTHEHRALRSQFGSPPLATHHDQ